MWREQVSKEIANLSRNLAVALMGSGASSQAPSGALLPKATSRSREWCPDTQQKGGDID